MTSLNRWEDEWPVRKPAPPAVDPERERRVEQAIRVELGNRRSHYVLKIMKVSGLVLVGALMTFVLPTGPDAVRPDGWLVRTFGQAGATVALRALGVAAMVAGVLWIAGLVRALTSGQRARELELRELLDARRH
jgi:hypothetical protein